MDALEQSGLISEDDTKRRERVSTAERYTALEGLLPASEIEIESRASYIQDFPDDEDHVEDVKFVEQGKAAIELARRLIARKTYNIRRKQRALREEQVQAMADQHEDAGDDADRQYS